MTTDDKQNSHLNGSENSGPDSEELLRAKINTETALIGWEELQRYYASGSVLSVDDSLNLLDVAIKLSEDDKEAFQQWLEDGLVTVANETQALQWYEEKQKMWCSVIAPWVLVQPAKLTDNTDD